MIPAPLLHGLQHKSGDISRPKRLQAEPLGLEPSRQKPPHHWQTVAYGGLTQCSLLSQVAGITSHQTFDGIVESRIGRLGNDFSLTEGAEQELACPTLAVMRTKTFLAVCSESTDLILAEFLKAEPLGCEPVVQLNHDPNNPLPGLARVPVVHELAGKAIQVRAEWSTTAPAEELGI